VAPDGSVASAGATTAADFPTFHAFQPTLSGAQNAFAARLAAGGNGLIFSTFVGGHQTDTALGLALDSSSNVYVTGSTSSPDFPLVQAAQSTFGGGNSDGFVTVLAANGASTPGTGVLSSTFVGGPGDDVGRAIAVDPNTGNVDVVGVTSSATLLGQVAGHFGPGGGQDVLLAQLGSHGIGVNWVKELGGSGTDRGNALALGPAACLGAPGWKMPMNQQQGLLLTRCLFSVLVGLTLVTTTPGVAPPNTAGLEAVRWSLKAPVLTVAFMPGNKAVVAGCGAGFLRLCEARSGKPMRSVHAHIGGVTAVVVSADGRFLASTGKDGVARLWDQNLRLLRKVHEARPERAALAFSGDGRLLAVGWGQEAHIYETTAGRLVAEMPARQGRPGAICSLALSPAGDLLAVGENVHVWVPRAYEAGAARFWGLSSGKPLTPSLRFAPVPGWLSETCAARRLAG
jgi:WD40 repeat protein